MARSKEQGRQKKQPIDPTKPLSKRQMKRLAKETKAELKKAGAEPTFTDPPVTESESKSVHGDLLEKKYGFTLPNDFYQFWDFISQHLDVFKNCGLSLTGPYDFLSGKIEPNTSLSAAQLQMHGRFYFDPPEFLTILCSQDGEGMHIGYFRDIPSETPSFLAWNKTTHGTFNYAGTNIFAAVHTHLQYLLTRTKNDDMKVSINDLLEKTKAAATTLRLHVTYDKQVFKDRLKTCVTKSLHGLGLNVPVDKTGVGYRELPRTDANLRKLLDNIDSTTDDTNKNKFLDELQEIITFVQFANDECDYGMGYELGMDLFIHGSPSNHGKVSCLLPLAYELLGRNLFSEIVTLHLENRQKETPINCLTI